MKQTSPDSDITLYYFIHISFFICTWQIGKGDKIFPFTIPLHCGGLVAHKCIQLTAVCIPPGFTCAHRANFLRELANWS